jgi:NAD(P)H-flavin reductase/ferredoxin
VAAFGAPVWLWRDPDRPECGTMPVATVDAAKAALYSSALASDRHGFDGRVRPEWLDAFIALGHARDGRTPGQIEAARRLFRAFAEVSGALVKAHPVRASRQRRLAGAGASPTLQEENYSVDERSTHLTATTPSALSTRRRQGKAMTGRHRVRINGEEFWASNEEVLLDAALRDGIDIPHDCRSGQCGKCRVRIVKGQLFAGGARGASEEVHACECRVIADVTVAVEALPERLATAAHVATVRDVSAEVVEVLVVPAEPITLMPGQYLNVAFDGFPARAYCPTVCLEDPGRTEAIHFHIRRVAGGRVSSALGHEIAAGHAVKLNGPFGAAHLQPGLDARLVLVAEDTGFAPIWSIAAVALQEQPYRSIDLVIGSADLYMEPALRWLTNYPNVTASIGPPASADAPAGGPASHCPALAADDIVYVAGPPSTVHAVLAQANAAGAACLAETFAPSDHLAEPPSDSLLEASRSRRSRRAAHARRGAGLDRTAAIRSRRGLDFYLRGVAAMGAIVACSGLLLGALLPAGAENGSVSARAPSAAVAREVAADGTDLPNQIAAQFERDRQGAFGQSEDGDDRLRPGDGTAPTTEDAKRLAVAGVWAPDASACSARQNRKRLIPAVITADGASAGDTFCAFKKKKPTETGMDVVADCTNANRQWTARVRLTVNGNRLVWASERGTQAYFRCEPNLRMAEIR